MSENSSNTSSGIGFCGLLAIVFITIKLLNQIAWSWWWVLSPVWIPVVAVLCFIAFAAIFIMFFGKED